MNRTFHSEWWEVTVPPGWTGNHGEDCANFVADSEDGCGALQISAYCKDETMTDADLVEMIAEDVHEADVQLMPVRLGKLIGFYFSQPAEEVHWRKWFARCGDTMVYAIYNCGPSDEGEEDEPVDQILSTLKIRHGQ